MYVSSSTRLAKFEIWFRFKLNLAIDKLDRQALAEAVAEAQAKAQALAEVSRKVSNEEWEEGESM